MLEERGKRVGHKPGGMQGRSQEGMFLPVLSSSPGDTRVSCEVRRHGPTFCFQKPGEKHCRSQPTPLPSLYFPNIQEGEEEARNLRNGLHCFMSLPEMAPHPVLRFPVPGGPCCEMNLLMHRHCCLPFDTYRNTFFLPLTAPPW